MDATVIRRPEPISRRSDTDSRALYAVAAVSVILLALMLPMLSWIRVVNAEALFDAMKLKASAVKKLGTQYSVFTFLNFVQDSKQGTLGLWSFVLMMVAAGTAVFHAWGLILFLLRKKLAAREGLLGMYGKLTFSAWCSPARWRWAPWA